MRKGMAVGLIGAMGFAIVLPGAARAVTFGQIDSFQDGTPMNWVEGAASPNPPTNIATGGPAGSGDSYLLNVSGGFGAGSKQVMFNQAQWLGDYNAAGVTRIRLNLANFGATDLFMRIAVEGGQFTSSFGSTNPIVLAANSGW